MSRNIEVTLSKETARSVYRGKLTLKLFYYKETYVLSIHIYYICTEIYYNII